jgi:cation diffusion facilitator CzcD-associated flavoprotein CzcO
MGPGDTFGPSMNETRRIPTPAGLAEHEARVRRDLETLNLPARDWVPPLHRDGQRVLDVLVIGAGMNGIAAAGALMLAGLGNLRLIERAEPGREGPWVTFARMDTLRSPKTLPGPCFGIPSLAFRAWYEATRGAAAWEALYKIPNAVWQDYLSWLQRVLDLPIAHGVALTRIEPADGLLRAHLSTGEALLARRIVLATGRAGTGGFFTPEFLRHLPPHLLHHAGDAIDFARLAGRSVAVLGGGASAWDNAATALERGAHDATLYVRRATLPQVNKSRGAGFPFHLGWGALDDARRWELIAYMHDHLAPPPHETVRRALALPGFAIRLATPVLAVREAAGQVVLTTPAGEHRHDALIAATGFAVDVEAIEELGALAPHVARWQDRYTPPPGLERPEMAAFPYLGEGFELLPRHADAPPEIQRIHLFNYGAHASFGGIASDIPGLAVAADRLAKRLAIDFFREGFPALRAEVEAFEEPELITTPFFVPKEQRA